MKFTELAEIVLEQRAEDGIRGIRSERHRHRLHLATAAFAGREVAEIERVEIIDWTREMSKKKAKDTRGDRTLSPESTKRSLAFLRAVFTVAVERGIRETNPCDGVRLKKRVDVRSTREKWSYLKPDEQRAFIEAPFEVIPEHDRLPILFSMYTGIRQGELSHNVLDDLHLDGPKPHIFVRFARKDLPPKNARMRTVPLIPQAIPVARRWLELLPEYAPHNPDRLIFPTRRGKRRGVGKPLERKKVDGKHVCTWLVAKQSVGLTRRFRWHDLRHTCGTSLLQGWWGRRWTLEEVREMLGHATVQQTEKYAHVAEETLHKAARETTPDVSAPASTKPKPQLELDFAPKVKAIVGPGLVRTLTFVVRAVREAIGGDS